MDLVDELRLKSWPVHTDALVQRWQTSRFEAIALRLKAVAIGWWPSLLDWRNQFPFFLIHFCFY